MIYCNACAQDNSWPLASYRRPMGVCEVCRAECRDLNDSREIHPSDLGLPNEVPLPAHGPSVLAEFSPEIVERAQAEAERRANEEEVERRARAIQRAEAEERYRREAALFRGYHADRVSSQPEFVGRIPERQEIPVTTTQQMASGEGMANPWAGEDREHFNPVDVLRDLPTDNPVPVPPDPLDPAIDRHLSIISQDRRRRLVNLRRVLQEMVIELHRATDGVYDGNQLRTASEGLHYLEDLVDDELHHVQNPCAEVFLTEPMRLPDVVAGELPYLYGLSPSHAVRWLYTYTDAARTGGSEFRIEAFCGVILSTPDIGANWYQNPPDCRGCRRAISDLRYKAKKTTDDERPSAWERLTQEES